MATQAHRMAEKRRAAGLSQEALARLCDVSTGTIARIERGETGLRMATAVRIAKALGVTLDQIFGEREEA